MYMYTFNPPEEELINHYLNNKIIDWYEIDVKQINEVNICHHEPADLPGLAKIESSHTWYFISSVEKFGKLNRTKRASKTGHWKITGNSCTIKDVHGNPIGLKKFLVFQESKKSSSSSTTGIQQNKTTWIIHEFHSFIHHPNKDAFVLCKLMKKRARLSRAVTDVSPSVVAPSPILTSNPILNHYQMRTENKNIVEDYGGDYCDDLEELDNHSHQFDNFHWGTFADTTHDMEFVESWNNEIVVGQVMFPNAAKMDQI